MDIVDTFLSMGSGEFTLTNVGLAHQYIEILEQDEDRLLVAKSLSEEEQQLDHNTAASLRQDRSLHNAEIARLELGFRVRGESESPSEQELVDVLLQTIDDDPDNLLTNFKTGMGLPCYMKYAGEINIRRVLNVPKPKKDTSSIETSSIETAEPEGFTLPIGGIIGIALGILLVVIVSGVIVYRKKLRVDDDSDSSASDSSDDVDAKDYVDNNGEYYSDDEEDLSSRWFSDYEGSEAGNPAEEPKEEFDVKAAFYGGAMKPSHGNRSAASSSGRRSRRSNASSSRGSRRSYNSSMESSRRSRGSSRGNGRLSTGVSRVSSAVSQGSHATPSIMSVFSSEYSESTRSSLPSKTSSYARSKSTQSSYPSRTSQSTRSYLSRTNKSIRSNVSTGYSDNYSATSRYSEASGYTGASNYSESSASMATRSQSTNQSPSIESSMVTRSIDSSRRYESSMKTTSTSRSSRR